MHVELSLPLIGFKIFIEIRSNFDNKVIKLCALSWELNKREHFQGSHEVFHWDSAILRCNALETCPKIYYLS